MEGTGNLHCIAAPQGVLSFEASCKCLPALRAPFYLYLSFGVEELILRRRTEQGGEG